MTKETDVFCFVFVVWGLINSFMHAVNERSDQILCYSILIRVCNKYSSLDFSKVWLGSLRFLGID
jgi:hypothetical protein